MWFSYDGETTLLSPLIENNCAIKGRTLQLTARQEWSFLLSCTDDDIQWLRLSITNSSLFHLPVPDMVISVVFIVLVSIFTKIHRLLSFNKEPVLQPFKILGIFITFISPPTPFHPSHYILSLCTFMRVWMYSRWRPFPPYPFTLPPRRGGESSMHHFSSRLDTISNILILLVANIPQSISGLGEPRIIWKLFEMIAIVIEQITQTPKEFEIFVHCRLIRVERDSTSQLNQFLAFRSFAIIVLIV